MKRGVISPNTALLLGPDIGDGSFKPASIKSIHYKRLPVGQVVAGQTAALALKKVKRAQVTGRGGQAARKQALALVPVNLSDVFDCAACTRQGSIVDALS